MAFSTCRITAGRAPISFNRTWTRPVIIATSTAVAIQALIARPRAKTFNCGATGTDAASAIAFFALLGFRQERVATIDGGAPARYMGMADMKAKHVTLALEGCEPRFEVQLLEFEPVPPDDPGEHPTNLRRRGYNHLAFRVDDIRAVTAHLIAHGVTLLSDEMDYLSRSLRLFEGPEGITLELVQWGDAGRGQG